MSMALEGVGFSFGIDDSAVSSALSRVSGKMEAVAQSFGALQDKAVTGVFEAVNKGFAKTAGGLQGLSGAMRSGVAAIPGKVFQIGSAAVSAGMNVTKFLGGGLLGLAGGGLKKVLGGIGDGLKGLFSGDTIKSMNQGINLTSSLEGEAVSTGKSMRELGANFGYSGKELDKFVRKGTSMSISTKIGADEVAKSLRAWDEAAEDLKPLGFNSAKDLAKFTSAFHTDADMLRNTTMKMREEFGLTDKEIANVVGSTARMGKVTGDVSKALSTLPDLTKRMQEQASRMGVTVEGSKLANFAAQTNALAAGLMQVNQDSDEVRESASGFAEALLKSEAGFSQMFSGVKNELPDLAKELAITTGNADEAFKLMEAGPSGFVKGMIKMAAEAKKSGTLTDDSLTFVTNRLGSVLGEKGTSVLVNFMRTAKQSTLDVMSSTEEASDNLNKMGKEAFRTGRTMADEFDFATERMFDKFRALGKPAARDWLKRIQKGMSNFGDKVKAIGKDKGPLGSFVTKMSEAASIGAQALVPKALQPTTMVLGQMMDKLGPTMDALGGLGINFTSIGGLASAAASAIGLFTADVVLNKEEGESWSEAISKAASKFAGSFTSSIKTVGSWLEQAGQWFADFDISSLFKTDDGQPPETELENTMMNIKNQLGEWASWEKWKGVADDFATGFSKVWTWITTSDAVQSNVEAFKGWVKSVIADIANWEGWETIGAKIMDLLGNGLKSGATTLLEKTPLIGSLMGVFGGGQSKKAAEKGEAAKVTDFAANADAGMGVIYGWLGMGGGGDEEKGAGKKGKGSPISGASKKMAAEMNTMSSATEASMSSMSSDFAAMSTSAQESIGAIETTSSEFHGNSINTDAKRDLDLTVEVFQNASNQIIGILDVMFMEIVGRLESTLMGIQTTAESMVASLKAVAGMEAVLSGSTDFRTTISPTKDKERDERIAKLTSDDAIHNPMWYFGSQGYERLFNAKMDQLIAAVYTTQTAQSTVAMAQSRVSNMMPAPQTSRARVPSPVR